MNKQWIVFSLTVWGVVVAGVTAFSPFLPDWMTPEWIASVDETVKAIITNVGVVVGLVMVLVDRFKISSGETPKALTFNPREDKQAKKLLKLS